MLLFDKKFLLTDNDKQISIAAAICCPDEIAESERVCDSPQVWVTNSKIYHVQSASGEWTPEFVEEIPPHVAQFIARGHVKFLPSEQDEEFAINCAQEFAELGAKVTMLYKIPDIWFENFFVKNPLVKSSLDMLFESKWRVSSCVAKKCNLSQIGWHRDYPYTFDSDPAAALSGIQFVVLLDEATEHNGATEYLEGSHKLSGGWSSNLRLKQFVGRPGTVFMFHAALWHRSGSNFVDSQSPRSVILLNIVSEDVEPKDQPEAAAPKNVDEDEQLIVDE